MRRKIKITSKCSKNNNVERVDRENAFYRKTGAKDGLKNKSMPTYSCTKISKAAPTSTHPGKKKGRNSSVLSCQYVNNKLIFM